MGKVALAGMEFHAYHGVYPEEAVLGNRFTIDLELETDFRSAMINDELDGTIDYGKLYQLVKNRMGSRVKLLEHLGHGIIMDILETYPHVKQITVILKKQQPALGGLVNFSSVTVNFPQDYQ
jgi:7,8-dihydroneopterin aldolase/epimerase/oxygenase